MIGIKDINISLKTSEEVFIEWDFKDGADINNLIITIKRFGAPYDSFDEEDSDVIANQIDASLGYFNDNSISLSSKNKDIWYMFRLEHQKNGDIKDYGPEILGYSESYPYAEIVIRNNYLLKHYIGVKALIYKHRKWGSRCPECWNDITKRSDRSNCKTCQGTTYKDGYHNPIETFANFSPSQLQIQESQIGELENDASAVFLSNYPRVRAKDLIVEQKTNKMWRVQKISQTELKRKIVHQMASCIELDPYEQVEYKEIDISNV